MAYCPWTWQVQQSQKDPRAMKYVKTFSKTTTLPPKFRQGRNWIQDENVCFLLNIVHVEAATCWDFQEVFFLFFFCFGDNNSSVLTEEFSRTTFSTRHLSQRTFTLWVRELSADREQRMCRKKAEMMKKEEKTKHVAAICMNVKPQSDVSDFWMLPELKPWFIDKAIICNTLVALSLLHLQDSNKHTPAQFLLT